MANLGLNFNARTVDPATAGGSSLPVGDQPVIIESSEVKPTKDNDGGYLQLNLRVIDGPAKGAAGPWRLNIYNSNPQAVDIAYRQLSAICHCVGVYDLNDSSALHNRPFIAVVGPQSDPKYTEVKGCKDIAGNAPKAGQAPGQGQAPQQPQGMPPGAPAAGWTAPQQAQAPAQQAPQGWTPPGQPAAQPAAPAQGWTPPAQPQQPAQGGWTPPGQQQQPQAPAQQPQQQWQPGAAPPGAPSWATPR